MRNQKLLILLYYKRRSSLLSQVQRLFPLLDKLGYRVEYIYREMNFFDILRFMNSESMVLDPIAEHSSPLEIDDVDPRVKYARKTATDPEPKEIETARYLAKHYDVEIIFLPIREIVGMKNPDIMIGREFAELKYVTGGLKAIGRNFKKATAQAQNIILHIVPESAVFTQNEIHNAIYGEIQELIKKNEWDQRKPKSLIVIFDGKLYSWKLYKKTKPRK